MTISKFRSKVRSLVENSILKQRKSKKHFLFFYQITFCCWITVLSVSHRETVDFFNDREFVDYFLKKILLGPLLSTIVIFLFFELIHLVNVRRQLSQVAGAIMVVGVLFLMSRDAPFFEVAFNATALAAVSKFAIKGYYSGKV